MLILKLIFRNDFTKYRFDVAFIKLPNSSICASFDELFSRNYYKYYERIFNKPTVKMCSGKEKYSLHTLLSNFWFLLLFYFYCPINWSVFCFNQFVWINRIYWYRIFYQFRRKRKLALFRINEICDLYWFHHIHI